MKHFHFFDVLKTQNRRWFVSIKKISQMKTNHFKSSRFNIQKISKLFNFQYFQTRLVEGNLIHNFLSLALFQNK